ncbi:kinase-like domain-containing protein [Rhizophagus irregularis DAOM 181602=DAOM 197198]|nr:kinase-like domain-containing protein [Rhizophagus irregularis DAOM 181602=DAOM 197198]
MGTKFSNLNISNNDINTINNENCLYCSKPFTNELWCKECINSLEKLAENGNREAIFNLAIRYEGGNGTEKNLEKAFYWYKKAAENGDADAMNNLAVCYEYGEGIEKNLEKAFYWYQKAAENGVKEAMFNLAMCCYSGEGTEKNLEKAFSWYQNAAEHGNTSTMNNLAGMYYNGEGTEKNLEKAFYWQQRATRSNEVSYNNEAGELCNECKQPYTYYQWCQQCNTKQFQQDFSKWTSKNEFIDKFIQEAQLKAKNSYEILEWIPYDKLSSINYYDKGRFSEIHKAIWLDGPIFSWNFDKKQWNRCNFQTGYEVILKTLNNSSNLNDKFLEEWKYHYTCQKKSFSKFIQFCGITKDPNSLNYIIVMRLKVIHESNLTHGDFHDGNILMSDNQNELFIIDLGLCKPISDTANKINEIYGVLPYMAPEILRKKPYAPTSDIYSFSMIMWEFTSGIPPFNYEAHDFKLILSICGGKRPEIIENTPKCYVDLMKKCWDSDPANRPTIIMLENIISEWIGCISDYYRINSNGDYEYVVPNVDNQLEDVMLEFVEANKSLVQEQVNASIIQSHPQAHYTSRKLSEILVQETQGFDCVIED